MFDGLRRPVCGRSGGSVCERSSGGGFCACCPNPEGEDDVNDVETGRGGGLLLPDDGGGVPDVGVTVRYRLLLERDKLDPALEKKPVRLVLRV